MKLITTTDVYPSAFLPALLSSKILGHYFLQYHSMPLGMVFKLLLLHLSELQQCYNTECKCYSVLNETL